MNAFGNTGLSKAKPDSLLSRTFLELLHITYLFDFRIIVFKTYIIPVLCIMNMNNTVKCYYRVFLSLYKKFLTKWISNIVNSCCFII